MYGPHAQATQIAAKFPGGLPYKNYRVARRKFWKEPLKGTGILISDRGPN